LPPGIFLRKTSLTDYPEKISSVLFFSECNLRCPWCHNSGIFREDSESQNYEKSLAFEECLMHLVKRKNILDGVVLSGGEPCLTGMLPQYIKEIKKLNLKVKLDTNGMFPEILIELFKSEETRPDYIALDLKISPSRYRELLPPLLSQLPVNFYPENVLTQSALLIRESDIAHEYRSLILPGNYFTEDDIEELSTLTDDSPWYFRTFRGGNCLDPAWNDMELSHDEYFHKVEAFSVIVNKLGKTAYFPGSI